MFLFSYFILLLVCDILAVVQHHAINLLPDTMTCGIERLGYRAIIIGGRSANLTQFPWLCLLEYSDGELDCGGALISNRYVLTAAHCLDNEKYHLVSVRLGENNIKTDPDCASSHFCAHKMLNAKVEKQIAHENYRRDDHNLLYDIALLRLKDKVNFTVFISPICLPLASEFLKLDIDRRIAWVAGWGQTEKGWRSDLKLSVDVPLVSNDICNEEYGRQNNYEILDSQICAGGEEGKDACFGDSGGPLMIREGNFYIIGVVSHGNGCGLEGVPGVYTRVTAHLQWILNNLEP